MKTKKEEKSRFLFEKKNYQLMILGLIIITLGFILMAGGGSDNPKIFNEAVFNFRRIRLAPTLVILGLVIQIFAILYKPKTTK